ncbi:hypothetical protein BC830DRAFT_1144040 [Chytriomyces sp. MP71]|nr:hypothetical protein BC830DRAFT_1144040 [Chytriomyces sp. MP71]
MQNGLAYSTFLLLLALLVFPIGLYVRCVGFKSPVKNALFHTNTKYFTIFSLVTASFCIIIGVICGFEGSQTITNYIRQIPVKSSQLTTDANAVVETIPSAVSNAMHTLLKGLNDTVDDTLAGITLPTVELAEPGGALLAAIQTMLLFQEWVVVHAVVVDAKIGGLSATVARLQTDVKNITNTVKALNSFYLAPPPSRLQYQLREPAASNTNFTEIANQLAYIASQLLPATVSPLSNGTLASLIARLPNLTYIHDQLNATLRDPRAALNKHVAIPLKSRISAKVLQDTNVTTQTDFARNLSQSIARLNETVAVQYIEGYHVESWDLARFVCFAVLLGTSVQAMVVLVGVAVGKSSLGMKLLLTELAFVTFLVLLVAAGMFVAGVALAEACFELSDPNAVFVGAVSYNAGVSLQSFEQARQVCLDRAAPGGMVRFAIGVGVDPSLLNISIKANPVIQKLDLSQYTSFSLTDLLGNSTSTVTSPEFNLTLSRIHQEWMKYTNLLQYNIVSNTTTLAIVSQLQNLTASLAQINTSDSRNVAAFKIVSNPGKEVLTASMLALFLGDLQAVLQELKVALEDLKTTISEMHVLSKYLGEFEGIAADFENATRVLSPAADSVTRIATDFVSSSLQNVTKSFPQIKTRLYSVAGNATNILDDGIDCKVLAMDTVTIQNSVCNDFSLAVDSVWLAFNVIGFSLFVVLCVLPCVVSQLIYRKSSLRPAHNRGKSITSIATTVSQASKHSGLHGPRSKQFGKESSKIVDTRHADDMLNLSSSLRNSTTYANGSTAVGSRQSVAGVDADGGGPSTPIVIEVAPTPEMRQVSHPIPSRLAGLPPSYPSC